MRKLVLIISLFIISGLVLPIFAANNSAGAQNTNSGQQVKVSPSPTGSQVRNQNEVNTQNQGEDSQLQVNTQEEENLGEGEGLQTRSQTAIENMSKVAEQVQLLLQTRISGGIGEQVRMIAQEQNQAQTQIRNWVNKLNSKSKLARFLTGSDYGAIKNLMQQLEQNRLRIQQLEQLQNQLSNQGDITMVQETIQALIQENTSLQELITAEEKTFGLFGWLFKFFAR